MNAIKKILILSANPKDTNRLRLDEEVREIEEGLRRSKNREKFLIQAKWAVRLRDLRRALLDYEPDIVHFCGHGKENQLLVEDDQGKAAPIGPNALADLFELFENIECVLLNACYSEPQANAIAKHIGYVIGMNKSIKDKAAIEFAVGFYDALGAGKSFEEAFKFACNAIQMHITPQYLIPILKTRSDNSTQFLSESETDNPEAEHFETLIPGKQPKSAKKQQFEVGKRWKYLKKPRNGISKRYKHFVLILLLMGILITTLYIIHQKRPPNENNRSPSNNSKTQGKDERWPSLPGLAEIEKKSSDTQNPVKQNKKKDPQQKVDSFQSPTVEENKEFRKYAYIIIHVKGNTSTHESSRVLSSYIVPNENINAPFIPGSIKAENLRIISGYGEFREYAKKDKYRNPFIMKGQLEEDKEDPGLKIVVSKDDYGNIFDINSNGVLPKDEILDSVRIPHDHPRILVHFEPDEEYIKKIRAKIHKENKLSPEEKINIVGQLMACALEKEIGSFKDPDWKKYKIPEKKLYLLFLYNRGPDFHLGDITEPFRRYIYELLIKSIGNSIEDSPVLRDRIEVLKINLDKCARIKNDSGKNWLKSEKRNQIGLEKKENAIYEILLSVNRIEKKIHIGGKLIIGREEVRQEEIAFTEWCDISVSNLIEDLIKVKDSTKRYRDLEIIAKQSKQLEKDAKFITKASSIMYSDFESDYAAISNGKTVYKDRPVYFEFKIPKDYRYLILLVKDGSGNIENLIPGTTNAVTNGDYFISGNSGTHYTNILKHYIQIDESKEKVRMGLFRPRKKGAHSFYFFFLKKRSLLIEKIAKQADTPGGKDVNIEKTQGSLIKVGPLTIKKLGNIYSHKVVLNVVLYPLDEKK